MHIGVFDSGIGGITVLNELRRTLPGARFTYLGDTANLPYGSKTPAVIRRLCRNALSKLPGRRKLDALVVACNTASAVALEDIRKYMNPIPVLGVVEPGAEAAANAALPPHAPTSHAHAPHTRPGRAPARTTRTPRATTILVLATRATLQSGAYLRAIQRIAPQATVEQVACPLFVPMIEEGLLKGPLTRAILSHYLRPYRTRRGVALLGCTHYPWIAREIQKALPKMQVVNSAPSVAAQLRTLLGTPAPARAPSPARTRPQPRPPQGDKVTPTPPLPPGGTPLQGVDLSPPRKTPTRTASHAKPRSTPRARHPSPPIRWVFTDPASRPPSDR